MLLALLTSCSTPEEEAGAAALEYWARWGAPASQYDLVCQRDQVAKSRPEHVRERTEIIDIVGEDGWSNILEGRAASQVSVLSSELHDDGKSAAVTLRIEPREGEPRTEEVRLALQDGGWCTLAGWVEDNQSAELLLQVRTNLDLCAAYRKAWAFENAGSLLTETEALLPAFPASLKSEVRREMARGEIAAERSRLGAATKDWAGGRWIVRTSKDPMTDDRNVTAILESVEGIPNSIGVIEPVHAVFRCAERKLEFFLATGSMLDAHWRWDTVHGRHRFGSADAKEFKGGRSEDYTAVFLDSPALWAAQLSSNTESDWLVEFPVYRQGSQTAKFSLTATDDAVAQVLEACK